jgi:ubiquinone/menaquinone biosynthesis C-methylase UbiE
MFTKSRQFYDALYKFKDYSAASEELHALIQKLRPDAKSLLDCACGTGRHLEYLQKHYEIEGLDVSRDMLDIARKRIPAVPLHEGDMVDFNLRKSFDVVTCLFCSIGYVKTSENMQSAVSCMASHLLPGGILVLEPWLTPTSYIPGKVVANFVNEPELKIAWIYTSEISCQLSKFDIHYLVGTPHSVEYFIEKEEMGLFTHEKYLEAFSKANIAVDYDPKGLFGYGMYVGVKKL